MSRSRLDKQFQSVSTIVQHDGDYTGALGEVSIHKGLNQILLHDGCTCNGVAYAQLTPTECATVKGG